MEQRPYPFAYAHKDEFIALPPEEKPPHIWEALQYCEWRRTHGDVTEAEVDKQVEIMRHIAQDVAKHLAQKLGAEGAWRDQYDPRWPRYHPESKDPLYLTGCHPPLLFCLQDKDEERRAAASDASLHEMSEWLHSPAGMYGITDEDRRTTDAAAAQYADSTEKSRLADAEVVRTTALVDEARARVLEEAERLGLLPKPPKKPKKLD
ncbi:MAG: hypothetical protein WD716_09900 [Fimbriimonadaceae bacterium]